MAKSPGKRILVVTTSVAEYASVGYRTGLWLGELTHFVDVVTEAGHATTIASIAGGRVPIDPESLGSLVIKLGDTDKRYADRAFMDRLADTLAIGTMRADDFDAIFLTGGHGTMFDFPSSAELGSLITTMWEQGKIVSAVCHGPAGLLGATLADGAPLIQGKKATGFSWSEEKLAQRRDAVPFRLDEALKECGATYRKALRPMAEKVVVDGRLITGQNPMSAEGVGKAVVTALKKSTPAKA